MQGKNLVRHVSVTTIALLGLLAFGAVEQARASGFWDRHIVDGAARSDWLRDPLVIDTDCLFSNGGNLNCSDLIPATDWDDWVDFNFRCWNARCSSNGEYWVVHHNNEPAIAAGYDGASAESVANPHPNSGPPGQSLHVYGLGATDQVLRMSIQRESDNLNRVRMVVDHRDGAVQNNPLGPGGIPFLGFGADMRAGNGGPVSPINSSGPWTYGVRLELRKELHEVDHFADLSAVTYIVQMNAVWDGTPRLVQFPVFTDGTVDPYDNGSFDVWKWNWPYVDSYYYPGAEVVSVDPDWLEGTCSIPVPEFSGADWDSKDVLIRSDEIFQCLDAHNAFSDPLPVDAELAGFFVANEITGDDAFLRTSTKNWRVMSW